MRVKWRFKKLQNRLLLNHVQKNYECLKGASKREMKNAFMKRDTFFTSSQKLIQSSQRGFYLVSLIDLATRGTWNRWHLTSYVGSWDQNDVLRNKIKKKTDNANYKKEKKRNAIIKILTLKAYAVENWCTCFEWGLTTWPNSSKRIKVYVKF